MCGMSFIDKDLPAPTGSDFKRLQADVESLRADMRKLEGLCWRIILGGTVAVYFLIWVFMQFTLVAIRR